CANPKPQLETKPNESSPLGFGCCQTRAAWTGITSCPILCASLSTFAPPSTEAELADAKLLGQPIRLRVEPHEVFLVVYRLTWRRRSIAVIEYNLSDVSLHSETIVLIGAWRLGGAARNAHNQLWI